jgi:hypothetical protein
MGGRACSLQCSTSPCDACFSSSRSPAAPRSSRSSRSCAPSWARDPAAPGRAARASVRRPHVPGRREPAPLAQALEFVRRHARHAHALASPARGAALDLPNTARGDRRSAVRSASWSSDSRARTAAGATSASPASSVRSDSASRRRRSASSRAKQGSDPLAREPASRGASASAARRRACSRATSSPSTPSWRHGSTSSSHRAREPQGPRRGLHPASERRLGRAAGAPALVVARRPSLAPTLPDPRSRLEVQRRLRRGLPQRGDRDRPNTDPRSTGQRVCRALRRHRAARVPRLDPDHRPSPTRARPAHLRRSLQQPSSTSWPGTHAAPAATRSPPRRSRRSAPDPPPRSTRWAHSRVQRGRVSPTGFTHPTGGLVVVAR